MLQERNENRAAKSGDLLLAIGLVLLAVVANMALRAFSTTAGQGLGRLAAFLLFAAACGLFYKKRLASYRYTLYGPEGGDSRHETNEPRQPSFPAGTLLLERMVGDQAETALAIKGEEMLALLAPDGADAIGMIGGAEGKPLRLHKMALTAGPKSKAHSLLFCQGDQYYRLYFNPSDKMARLLSERIAAAAKR